MGNPPFMGGQRISGSLGQNYLRYLKMRWDHTRGSADYCAYFFLQGMENLRQGGTLGLIATNTIAQGDTRELGLAYISEQKNTIYRATNNQPWPGQAAVVVNVVHAAKGAIRPRYTLNEDAVSYISSYLDHRKVVGDLYRLAANQNKSFQGSNILGLGFTMSPEEAQALIARDTRNKDILFPYLNGEDLNSRPDQSPSRWVINFFDWPLSRGEEGSWSDADEKQRRAWLRTGKVPDDYSGPVADDYPDCLAIVHAKVYPERRRNRNKQRREIWWRFTRPTIDLYQAIAPLQRVLVVALTSKYLSFIFVSSHWVYAHACGVVAFENAGAFAVLQSSFHDAWARKHGSTLETRLRYTPADVFETFPFPDILTSGTQQLATLGEACHEHRRQIMLERQEGLTTTYNRFHSPDETEADIEHLRELHVQMDQAVATAYGWDDLALGHGFHETPQGIRFTISESARMEVLDRLLELNHQRYQEEVKAGLHAQGKRKTKASSVQSRDQLDIKF